MESGVRTDPLALARAPRAMSNPATRDIDGVWHDASPEALVAVLRALGLPIDRPEDAPSAAARARGPASWSRVLEPVVVAWDGAPRRRAAPAAGAHSTTRSPTAGSTLEDGADARLARHGSVTFPWSPTTRLGSRTTSARRLHAPRRRSRSARTASRCSSPARPYECEVLAAPSRRVHEPVAIPSRAPGARSSRSPRCAPTAARAPATSATSPTRPLVAGRGAEIVASLPLLAAFLREPCEPSPYAPVSRRFWNELYLDLERIPDLRWSPKAAALLEQPGRARRAGLAPRHRRASTTPRRRGRQAARAREFSSRGSPTVRPDARPSSGAGSRATPTSPTTPGSARPGSGSARTGDRGPRRCATGTCGSPTSRRAPRRTTDTCSG